jgi:hypothetical protein
MPVPIDFGTMQTGIVRKPIYFMQMSIDFKAIPIGIRAIPIGIKANQIGIKTIPIHFGLLTKSEGQFSCEFAFRVVDRDNSVVNLLSELWIETIQL